MDEKKQGTILANHQTLDRAKPFTEAERAQLAENASRGVSPTPGDVARYERSFTLMGQAVEALHDELDYLACDDNGGVPYESAAFPGSCLCTYCCLHWRVSDVLIQAAGRTP